VAPMNERFTVGFAAQWFYSVTLYIATMKLIKFEIGERRLQMLKKDEIKMFERGSPKMATFTLCRWAPFVKFFGEID
jgi:hypothetical protein